MGFTRPLSRKIQTRLASQAPLIQVVVGPRQVGKTTAIRQAISTEAVYETADSPTPHSPEIISALWSQALERPNLTLVIDEIQKISGWAETVKKLWDTRKQPLKVVLSGSAALSIEKNLKESLAGRYELIKAEHWNFQEAQMAFGMSLQKFVEFGCYPGSIPLLDDVPRWASYIRDSIVEPVIGRDILQLHPVDNPALLRQTFGLCAASPAHIISLNKLQGQLQDRGALATIQHYLHLLGQAFVVSTVEKYSASAFRVRRSIPKIVVHDNALLKAFERPVDKPISSARFGHYLENSILARLIESGWDVYYWKERDLEVDIVTVDPNGEHWAFEVKSGPFSIKELAGLKKFMQLFPKFKVGVIALPEMKKSLLPFGFPLLDAEKFLMLRQQQTMKDLLSSDQSE